jgi:Dyp-type peroxidase family
MAGLDTQEIQGNILMGYRSHKKARFMFFRVADAAAGRAFLGRLLGHVTPAQWHEAPAATTNIAVSYAGLCALGVKTESAGSFAVEYREGMRARASSLGDTGDSAPTSWDEPWRDGGVDLMVMCYAPEIDVLNAHCDALLADLPDGVDVLEPHQDAAQNRVDGALVEHFGFVDGLSNPEIAGAPVGRSSGRVGNPTRDGHFEPVPAGEFILGHPAYGGEERPWPTPRLLSRNGSYLVFRKLAQDVAGFRRYLREQAKVLAKVAPGHDEAFLAAKMVGRWPDGTPLVANPRDPETGELANEFDFLDDPEGALCPLGAHIRRSNPRAGLGLGGELTKRRRIIRRGITYGDYVPPDKTPDDEPRGIIFLAYAASIERQFEFLQQNWINNGDDFRQGNDKDAITGDNDGTGRMVIPGDERVGRVPFLCTKLPRFVTVKGGEYFFVPSLTGLRLLAEGRIEMD